MWEKLKGIAPDTWARTVCFFLALINQVLVTLGKNILPFEVDDAYKAVTVIATIVTGIIAWWKDNPITAAARKSNAYMKKLKAEEKVAEIEAAVGDQLEDIEAFEEHERIVSEEDSGELADDGVKYDAEK